MFILIYTEVKTQGVSINSSNSTAHPSAILDIQSTNHGILFPRMTTVQRNTIPNPAHGLHIFNTNIGTLEYYDTIFHTWFRYCKGCGYYTDTLKASQDTLIHGYKLPQLAAAYRKIILVIDSTVDLTSGYMYPNYSTPIDLSAASEGATILIVNHGSIIGPGGSGGNGGETTEDANCYAQEGQDGKAVTGNPGNNTVINYGNGIVYGIVD
jgi:hypothetical protein